MDAASATRLELEKAHKQYAARNPRSSALHKDACRVLPGGSTRTALFYLPFPVMMVRGEGSHLWDADEQEYADFLGEYTAGLYGHTHPKIRAAMEMVLAQGINLGGHSPLEALLAEKICERFPSIAQLRFTNSGTEANFMAVSASCAITSRKKILVFDGAYHGGAFSFSHGKSRVNAPFEFVTARYNDLDATMDVLAEYAEQLAAILVEPMLGAGGCLPAEAEFLKQLRGAATACGALLIFDEVMTSRLAWGGLQSLHNISPDFTTLGKYIGGGMTCGAFGGSREVMRCFDGRNADAFPHAGTFNNNVVTMAAGIAGLSVYDSPQCRRLNDRGDELRRQLNRLAESHQAPLHFTGLGSMMNVHLCRGPLRTPSDLLGADQELAELFFFDLLSEGIWLARRGMIVLSLPTSEADCEALVSAVESFIRKRGRLFQNERRFVTVIAPA